MNSKLESSLKEGQKYHTLSSDDEDLINNPNYLHDDDDEIRENQKYSSSQNSTLRKGRKISKKSKLSKNRKKVNCDKYVMVGKSLKELYENVL